MEYVLVGLIADAPAVLQNDFRVIRVENTFDIFRALPFVRMALVKFPDFFFRGF